MADARPMLQFPDPTAIPVDEIPSVLGEVEQFKATLWARLTTPGSTAAGDRMLDVDEAVIRTGMSKTWLYRHHAALPFARKIGRKVVFDEAGLVRWLARRR